MRMNVEVEDGLIGKAMGLTGLKTYRAVLEESLKALIGLYEQGEVRDLRGKLHRQPDDDARRRR